jgi:hypothetical protein
MNLTNRLWGCGLDLSGSGEGPVTSSCEHGDENSGFVNVGNSLTS